MQERKVGTKTFFLWSERKCDAVSIALHASRTKRSFTKFEDSVDVLASDKIAAASTSVKKVNSNYSSSSSSSSSLQHPNCKIVGLFSWDCGSTHTSGSVWSCVFLKTSTHIRIEWAALKNHFTPLTYATHTGYLSSRKKPYLPSKDAVSKYNLLSIPKHSATIHRRGRDGDSTTPTPSSTNEIRRGQRLLSQKNIILPARQILKIWESKRGDVPHSWPSWVNGNLRAWGNLLRLHVSFNHNLHKIIHT